MSEFIDKAIDVFEQQIQALYTNDFEKFKSYMTKHIQSRLTFELFQRAIDLYKHTPIGREAIDLNQSLVYNEGEIVEIPERHVKLVLVGSGRTLCHVVESNDEWLIDDIYWRAEELEPQEQMNEEETQLELPSEDVQHPVSDEEDLADEVVPEEITEEDPIETEIEDTQDEILTVDKNKEEETTDE